MRHPTKGCGVQGFLIFGISGPWKRLRHGIEQGSALHGPGLVAKIAEGSPDEPALAVNPNICEYPTVGKGVPKVLAELLAAGFGVADGEAKEPAKGGLAGTMTAEASRLVAGRSGPKNVEAFPQLDATETGGVAGGRFLVNFQSLNPDHRLGGGLGGLEVRERADAFIEFELELFGAGHGEKFQKAARSSSSSASSVADSSSPSTGVDSGSVTWSANQAS